MRAATLLAGVLAAACTLAQEPPAKLSLNEALRIAKLNSPILNSIRAEAEAARSATQAARAGLLPQLSANGFAASGNNAGLLGSPPGVDPPAWMLVPTGTFFDGNLSLMVPLFDPQKNALQRVAGWQARAADAELAEAGADLTLTVTESYGRVALSRKLVQAEEAKVASTEELVRTAQTQLEVGLGIEASVHRAQAELARANRGLTSARNEQAKAVLDLYMTMGVDLASSLDPSDDLRASPTTLTLAEYIQRSRERRGMLVAARARVQAAGSDVRVAEGQRLPHLYGAVMGDVTNRRDMGGLTAGLALSFPLFDGGRIRAEVAGAKAMKARAEADLKKVELEVEKEVRQAWLDLVTARANVTSAQSSVAAAQSAYEVISIRVSVGKSILVEQLDALEALMRAKSDLAQAAFDEVFAVAKLERASGGNL